MGLRLLRGIGIAVLLAFGLMGCREAEEGGSTAGTILYVFDAATGSILAWDDVEALYAAPATTPTRTITGGLLSANKVLGWGGLCLDTSSNLMYAVSETGRVVRIDAVSRKNGDLSSAVDIVSFTLDTNARLSDSVFGQASVDTRTGTLYVTETGSSSTRIWVIPNPGTLPSGATVPLSALQTNGDTGGMGVIATQGTVWAYFTGGNAVTSPARETFTGSRLRKGTSSGFTSVVLGPDTTLGENGTMGCLAVDASLSLLYVARRNPDLATGGPVAVFELGAFTSGYNQAPKRQIGSLTDQAALRIVTHPGGKDWLAGANGLGGVAGPRLWLWKNPSQTDAPLAVDLSAGVLIKGLAMDGSG